MKNGKYPKNSQGHNYLMQRMKSKVQCDTDYFFLIQLLK